MRCGATRASVLVGDFLYSRSFQLMVELDRMPVMQVLADTTNRIAEGEVLQLLHVGNPDTDEAAYLRVIERKTAVLFAAATRLGAMLAGADASTLRRARRLRHEPRLRLPDRRRRARLRRRRRRAGQEPRRRPRRRQGHAAADPRDGPRRRRPRASACARSVEHGDRRALPEVVAAIHASGGLEYSRASRARYAQAAEARARRAAAKPLDGRAARRWRATRSTATTDARAADSLRQVSRRLARRTRASCARLRVAAVRCRRSPAAPVRRARRNNARRRRS